MSFALRNLSVLAYAQGFTLWHYRGDPKSAETITGFFSPAADMIATGDILLVSGNGGARMLAAVNDNGEIRTAPLG